MYFSITVLYIHYLYPMTTILNNTIFDTYYALKFGYTVLKLINNNI